MGTTCGVFYYIAQKVFKNSTDPFLLQHAAYIYIFSLLHEKVEVSAYGDLKYLNKISTKIYDFVLFSDMKISVLLGFSSIPEHMRTATRLRMHTKYLKFLGSEVR